MGSIRSTPCPSGSFYPLFNATQPSDCPQCPPDFYSSSGASACSPCAADTTSSAGAAACSPLPPCVPSAFSVRGFNCYSTLAQVFVILGYVVSVLSSLFSMYKLRMFVRERVQKLQAAGIKPTLKRVVFLERTLANHSKHMLLPRVEQGGAASVSMDEARPASDEAVVRMLRDLQTQMQQQQQQQQQQQHEDEHSQHMLMAIKGKLAGDPCDA